MKEPAPVVDQPADPLTETWQPEQVAALDALRDWAVGFGELNQHMASFLGLPSNDANALGHVVWAAEDGAPLSPVQLSRRIGLTSGATTVLLDRLARAGLVARSRESEDRRRVTLRPTAEGRELARGFIAFAGAEIAETLRTADPEDLRAVASFLSRLIVATAAANDRLARRENFDAGRPPLAR